MWLAPITNLWLTKGNQMVIWGYLTLAGSSARPVTPCWWRRGKSKRQNSPWAQETEQKGHKTSFLQIKFFCLIFIFVFHYLAWFSFKFLSPSGFLLSQKELGWRKEINYSKHSSFSFSPEKTHNQNLACATQGTDPTPRQLYNLEKKSVELHCWLVERTWPSQDAVKEIGP